MSSPDGSMLDIVGILAVLFLVAANGFFVAAEFSLVSVRRSRVTELVAAGRMNATALKGAVDNLDANLAATQLGITISSLALGWLGEPALAHLIEPALSSLPSSFASASSHAIAVAISFIIITALHIVLGELAPKSLALQRSEGTALWVVRPLGLFLFLLRPAIVTLNGLGNLVLRLCGLRPGTGEGSLHSPEELKLLIQASQEGGILQQMQQEVVARVLSIGDRRISDIMTPRRDVDWIDPDDDPEETIRIIRECRHEQLLVGRGGIDEPLGMVLKKDLLDQVLDGKPIDPMAIIHAPVVLHEGATIFRVLEQFKRAPVRLAVVVDEYGGLEGIVTQTDLLEALAGDLPGAEGEEPDVVEREDGSLLIDGMMPAHEAFERLGLQLDSVEGDFHTIAGLALLRLGRLPDAGDVFEYEGWRFEISDMDGRRIDKLLASRTSGDG
ncbi:hemolysin family protein [Bosea sp. (in: a-proteobacteria)]|uniref:hemolysin family protein n=1 Tax=Bosea sp. (in: a-proteobacteria) TaxID=1871050 RepID=UPI001ACB141C|nr:hemolysin family protein [Bosea sp. (in: a-proteobacteria)]MBN9435823.1 HlyC/CorC family transporter [Bosea sp. (in: a-proteobacteria)]